MGCMGIPIKGSTVIDHRYRSDMGTPRGVGTRRSQLTSDTVCTSRRSHFASDLHPSAIFRPLQRQVNLRMLLACMCARTVGAR